MLRLVVVGEGGVQGEGDEAGGTHQLCDGDVTAAVW